MAINIFANSLLFKSITYEDRLKCFEPQHEDDITCQTHSGTTIIYILQNTCENYSHFGRCCLRVICASQCFRLIKVCPPSLTLSLGNRKKSLRIRSGEYGG